MFEPNLNPHVRYLHKSQVVCVCDQTAYRYMQDGPVLNVNNSPIDMVENVKIVI